MCSVHRLVRLLLLGSVLPFGLVAQESIPCGRVIIGSIQSAGQRNGYTFPASGAEAITVRLVPVTPNFRPIMELLDPAGKQLTSGFDSITRTLNATGTYTVVVRYYSGTNQTGEYRLIWQSLSRPCNASPLTCGAAQRGSLDALGALAAYTFSATTGDAVTLRLLPGIPDFRLFMELYDPAGSQVTTSFSEITRTLTAAGLYKVLVRYYSGNNQTGGYQITWQRPNNPCNSSPLACGAVQSGSIESPAALKAHVFSVAAGDSITLRLMSTVPDFRPYMELYDPTGRQVTTSFSELSRTLSMAGNYAVFVRYYSGTNQTGGYRLIWQRLNSPCNPIPLTCGSVYAGVIDSIGALNAHALPVSANDVVTLRLASASSDFRPFMELYDPAGRQVVTGFSELTRSLSAAGSYTVLVRHYSGISQTGGYRLTWQRANNPCGASPLPCGAIQTASIAQPVALGAHTFPAAADEPFTLRLAGTSPNFRPTMDLYDPAGRLVTSGTSITRRAPSAGSYSVLVRHYYGDTLTGNYQLFLQRLATPCNAVELPCGTAQPAPISTPAEIDTYAFRANVGDILTIRLARTSGSVNPYGELFDETGARIATGSSRIDRRMDRTGLLTLLISDSTGDRTGGYALSWQRVNNPCNATAIECGQVLSGAVHFGAELVPYTISSNAGDTLRIRFTRSTSPLSPYLELYSRAGTRLASGYQIADTRLEEGGNLSMFVSDSSSRSTGDYVLSVNRSNSPCALIDRENPAISLTSLKGGDVLVAGTKVTITWRSSDNVEVASHEIRFSADGGASFPTTIASGLAGTVQSFTSTVPTDISTTTGRIRVIATDTVGNAAADTSASDLAIVGFGLPETRTITYKYDRLNRLIEVRYEDGSTITYSYDAAGNRTRLVTTVPPK